MFQRQADGRLARIAALDDLNRLIEFFGADARFEFLQAFRAGGDDDGSDERASGDAAEAQNDDGNAVEFKELFGCLVAHARAEARRGKNGSDLTHWIDSSPAKAENQGGLGPGAEGRVYLKRRVEAKGRRASTQVPGRAK